MALEKAKDSSSSEKAEAASNLTEAQKEEGTMKTNLAQAKKTPEELAKERQSNAINRQKLLTAPKETEAAAEAVEAAEAAVQGVAARSRA